MGRKPSLKIICMRDIAHAKTVKALVDPCLSLLRISFSFPVERELDRRKAKALKGSKPTVLSFTIQLDGFLWSDQRVSFDQRFSRYLLCSGFVDPVFPFSLVDADSFY